MKRHATRILAFASLLALSWLAQAQAFRAYLASYGSDANPCTVAQPCRLLPAALNAVLDGGEIWILDSANYNAATVDIAKSVSILAIPGQTASVVSVAGNPAITISTAGVSVALHNMVITQNVGNPGLHGIVMTNGSALTVEDSLFANITGAGIKVTGIPARVYVKDTTMRNMGTAVDAQDGPTVAISHSQFIATAGLNVYSYAGTTRMDVTDSVIAGGGGFGVSVNTALAGGVATATVTRTTISGVYSSGLHCSTNNVGTATLYVVNSTSTGNGYGYDQSGTCVLRTLGNNFIGGNTADNGTLTSQPLR
ncbi:MAG TPA: right-handed parallel beta-helix repeat-containing protein [Usitatibacter sp.]|jgi:hypothetical protein|nr:right-handed parallel beta-helix repeat-containing protein [Usitatibacter sp.]